MASENTVAYFGAGQPEAPDLVARFSAENGLRIQPIESVDDVLSLMNRSFPACVVADATKGLEEALDLCRHVKSDPFTAIVPVVVLVDGDGRHFSAEALEAGADEVVAAAVSEAEQWHRFGLVLRRAARDVSVHPSTRLPGTVQIERDITTRLEAQQAFATCYADLDHFKEFNDRYGYNHGDGVIMVLARILRDIVRALAPGGFVGHIGGDDFIFDVPLEHMEVCCDEILRLFDELIPYQYTAEDRRAGYFLGKDRRGSVHRIPLMTLSIGVVTNRNMDFSHTAQVSARAAEMKNYAKTLPGSVYVVDRRQTTIGKPGVGTGMRASDALPLVNQGAES
jgi:GGDEF domain-containing protein